MTQQGPRPHGGFSGTGTNGTTAVESCLRGGGRALGESPPGWNPLVLREEGERGGGPVGGARTKRGRSGRGRSRTCPSEDHGRGRRRTDRGRGHGSRGGHRPGTRRWGAVGPGGTRCEAVLTEAAGPLGATSRRTVLDPPVPPVPPRDPARSIMPATSDPRCTAHRTEP